MSQRLDNPDFREEFCNAVIDHLSVAQAAKSLNINKVTVWRYVKDNKDFADMLWAARAQAGHGYYDEAVAIADASTPERAQVDRLRIETRLRVAGKLMPKLYGEDSGPSQLNVGVQVGLVCTEEQRQQIIAMRERALLLPGTAASLLSPSRNGNITHDNQ